MRMVAKVEGYYGSDFQGLRGVTQGNLLSPTIFNVVVDAVVIHWVEVMVESADKQSRNRQEERHQNAFYYADDGMVVSLDPRWIQGAFSTLLGMFDRVLLKTNVRKTVGMVFRQCQASVTQSEVVYGQRMTGTGPSYR